MQRVAARLFSSVARKFIQSRIPAPTLQRQPLHHVPTFPLRGQLLHHAHPFSKPWNPSSRFFNTSTPHRAQYQYNRFSRSPLSFLTRWSRRPTFYTEVGLTSLACGTLYIANLEEIPFSHRRQFNILPASFLDSMSAQQESQILQAYRGRVLADGDPRVRLTKKVLERLLPHSTLPTDGWTVHVIDSPETNAFVIPGGKVFVFTGILPVCGGEDGLAAVLGHEIAHNVAHHASARMSRSILIIGALMVGSIFLGVDASPARILFEYIIQRPGSRREESEADYIGLLMMAASCYDPSAAEGLWARMEAAEQGRSVPPEFMSTHPSSHNRQLQIREWMPQALETFRDGGCAWTSSMAGRFRDTLDQATGGRAW